MRRYRLPRSHSKSVRLATAARTCVTYNTRRRGRRTRRSAWRPRKSSDSEQYSAATDERRLCPDVQTHLYERKPANCRRRVNNRPAMTLCRCPIDDYCQLLQNKLAIDNCLVSLTISAPVTMRRLSPDCPAIGRRHTPYSMRTVFHVLPVISSSTNLRLNHRSTAPPSLLSVTIVAPSLDKRRYVYLATKSKQNIVS